MPFWVMLTIFLCINACTSKDKNVNSNIEKITTPKKTFQPISFNHIYSVYELSDSTTAFVINFSEDDTEKKTILDTLIKKVFPNKNLFSLSEKDKDCKIYDTLGLYKLLASEKFENKVNPYFDKEYYVYGTKGSIKIKYKKVVFTVDSECITNFFAFCFDKKLLSNIGNPIICSDIELDINYSNNYDSAENKINYYLSKIPADYTDSIKAKVLGNIGQYYVTYSDDFLWKGHYGSEKCLFPSRGIYTLEPGKLKSKWTDGLDLFGIPCD